MLAAPGLRHPKLWFAWSLLVACILRVAPAAAVSVEMQLAKDGQSRLPIVVSAQAGPPVRELAATLADYLGRIAGAKFEVTVGDGQSGIALGIVGDFPHLPLKDQMAADGLAAEEQYVLRTHGKGLWAIGATETAVQHAVWDLLYRLGHRQFFPGEIWEVIPSRPDLKIAVDVHERPDYAYRSIWYGFGTWDHNAEPYRQWRIRNRAESRFKLNTGHSYDGILRRYRDEFRAHPEYLGLLGGERKSTKFCVANPGLRQLAVRYALDWFRENPDQRCVSIDPSDGGGWCECAICQELGSPSDRALTLANEISCVLERDHPGKYVAMYAYAQHSPPPAIEARPRVIVSVATSFIRGGYTVEQLIDGWRAKKVAQFGIREYYSVYTWDHDLPGAARGARLDYLARTIPQFHRLGARFLSAESSDNWGPNGLGYYVATRILWDSDEAGRVDALVDDFLQSAFGPARGPMKDFYALLSGPEAPRMSSDLVGRMYRRLAEARSQSDDPRIRARIDQLVLYARYVELYRAYANAKGEARQAAFEQLIRHAYRMRGTMLVHAKAIYRDLAARDKSVVIPDDATWTVPEGKNPWKDGRPWSAEEIAAILEQGIARNAVVDAPPVAYGRDLSPIEPALGADLPRLDDSQRGRGEQVFWTWADKAPWALELRVTGGLIAHYRDRGNVKMQLFSVAVGREELVAENSEVPPDGAPRTVTLRSPRSGLHKLVVNDGHDLTEVLWPEGLHRTMEISAESQWSPSGRRSAYFYVPRGTRTLVGYASPASGATICDSCGKVVFKLSDLSAPDHFQAPVPPGEDGAFWSVRGAAGTFLLLSVPPYCARHPKELLLPRGFWQPEVSRTPDDAATGP